MLVAQCARLCSDCEDGSTCCRKHPDASRVGRFQGLDVMKHNDTKQPKLADANEGADMLERLLDIIHGADRPAQIPGHYGNGTIKVRENKHAA